MRLYPLATVAPACQTDREEEVLLAPKPMILLVDDEPDLLGVLAEALGMAMPEYLVKTLSSYEDAEAALDALEDDLRLVVVDHLLGDRTGLDLLGRLRRTHPSVPSILFTGQATTDVEHHARAYGARVLWKPVRLRAWITEVRSALHPQ
ncbi:MAG: DNA-binding NtrC family response regulator [Myxococcota bacterium]|jgi:DNA-binding NtrC family response regulator